MKEKNDAEPSGNCIRKYYWKLKRQLLKMPTTRVSDDGQIILKMVLIVKQELIYGKYYYIHSTAKFEMIHN